MKLTFFQEQQHMSVVSADRHNGDEEKNMLTRKVSSQLKLKLVIFF